MQEHDFEEMQRTLETEGYTELDSSRRVFFFQQVASVLRHRRMETFEDLNHWIGTMNGIASGWVRMRRDELNECSYLRILEGGGVNLTAKGVRAAQAIGIIGIDDAVDGPGIEAARGAAPRRC
jgi:hypothetical protein